MAGNQFSTSPVSLSNIAFSGGLNTTAGPFAVSEMEASDLQNIDFNIFGSISKRNGYLHVTSAALGAFNSDGLHWFEFDSSGTSTRQLVNVANGKFYKMDTSAGEPDGTWDDATNGRTITADNFCDFVNWHNKCFVTNGYDIPLSYDGLGTTTLTTALLPTNVTRPKFIAQFENYLFYLNVYVSSVKQGSRFYWCELNNEGSWPATNFIRISDNDGTEITGHKVLSDRFVIFKERSIWNVFFTGDAAIPFTVQKSNSSVGCTSSRSIQEVQNGLVFLSQDGFYYYDGNNSYKLSDKIYETLKTHTFSTARSAVQFNKNRYLCSMINDDSSYTVFVWDFFNNAWSKYAGMTVSAMARVFINGTEERVYFADNSGYAYRMDYGTDDYPLSTTTAISAFYYTNWKPFQDLMIVKGIPSVVIYHTLNDTELTFTYSYDFETSDQYTEYIDMSGSGIIWDISTWDNGVWAGAGGKATVVDLTGRGRVGRFGFKNSTIGQTFRIDGMGLYVRGETAR